MNEIFLLGAFSVRVDDREVGPLSLGTQRLLTFLALHGRRAARATVAGTMWPDVSQERAGESLRSALWRLEVPLRESILSETAGLRLLDSVRVDLHEARASAARLLGPVESLLEADLSQSSVARLSRELLPDWFDDWVVPVAEDWRQLRMHALEAQSRLLIARNRLAEAATAARAAMNGEPLRESGHAALIRVHLAEGNQSEALRVFDRYRAMLRKELQLEPSVHISALVASLRRP
ncbi:MAG: putative transcriptional regulator [Microbacteriaceae bacterium]|jgi:DNA-binding SARP family transcriptional activator|nr:putative transcriptional regulator [Microbacteriaceae bacterium]